MASPALEKNSAITLSVPLSILT